MDLRQIHVEDVFGSSRGWVWRSGSKIKVTRNKNAILQPFRRPACGLWTSLFHQNEYIW